MKTYILLCVVVAAMANALFTPTPLVFHPIVYSGILNHHSIYPKLHYGSIYPQLRYGTIYPQLLYGSISNDLDDDNRSKPGSCPRVPAGSCAVLYDDENCKGWSHKVPYESYPAFDLPKNKRNDAEVVLVRSGCKFTGYDRVQGKGKGVSCDGFNNGYSDTYCDLSDTHLRDAIESVECYCKDK